MIKCKLKETRVSEFLQRFPFLKELKIFNEYFLKVQNMKTSKCNKCHKTLSERGNFFFKCKKCVNSYYCVDCAQKYLLVWVDEPKKKRVKKPA